MILRYSNGDQFVLTKPYKADYYLDCDTWSVFTDQIPCSLVDKVYCV